MRIEKPRISGDLPIRDFEDIFSEEDSMLETCTVTGAIFENEFIDKLRIYDGVFKNCRFSNCDFSGLDITDVSFENCDFSNADLSNGSIHRVEFKSCKFVGTNLSNSSFGNIKFEESVISLASFANSKFKKVLFDNVSAINTYFYDCRFASSVNFLTCDLDECNFAETPLKGVDISTSTFQSLTVSMNELKGCQVSSYQAVHIASMMGLKIKD